MAKKIISLLLALVLVLSLVACSNTDKETGKETGKEVSEGLPFEGKTLTFAGLEGGYGTKGWEEVIKKFEELTGATVKATYSQQIEEEVRSQFLSGQAPDVNYISLSREAGLTEAQLAEKQVLDITDAFDAKILGEEQTPKEKLLDGSLGGSTTNPYGDDTVYLAPINLAPNGFFHNASLFGEGKLTLPKTIDELVALEGKQEGAAVYTYPVAGYHDSVIPALINQVGGQDLYTKLMNYDSKAWETEATPVFEALGKILKHVNKNTVAQANGESFTQNQLQVMKNESLFMPNGTWVVNEMKEAEGVAEGFEWGLLPVPAYKEGADRYVYSFNEQVWVSAKTKEPELAKAFITFLYSDFAAEAFQNNGGAVIPTAKAIELIKDPLTKSFYDILSSPDVKIVSGGFAQAPAVEGVSVTDALYETINSVANGDKTVEEWQADVVKAVKAIEEAKAAQ